MSLQLEYSCTDSELEEAKSLQLREELGGGSQPLALVVMFGILALVLGLLFLRSKTELGRNGPLLFLAVFAVVFVCLLIARRKKQGETRATVRIEVTPEAVIFGEGAHRTTFRWSAFSRRLESPNLFVLVDAAKTTLFVTPKRVFPDEAAQDWFRAQTEQIRNAQSAVRDKELAPGRAATESEIAYEWRLKFRDYLDRFATSWRTKAIYLIFFLLITGMTFFTEPPPNAVHTAWETWLIMLPFFMVIITGATIVIAYYTWLTEKRHLKPQTLIFSEAGIEFTGSESSGSHPWSAYKYFRESRWSFFVWTSESVWFLFPKRDFASPEELNQFRVWLRGNLTASRWFFY